VGAPAKIKRIVIIQGHPDPRGDRYCDTLGQAYAVGAEAAGHEVRIIDVAKLDFPLLRGKDDFEHGTPPDSIRRAQDIILWAEHLVIIYPLWLSGIPALLKAFFEQTFRPGFAFAYRTNGMPKKLLAGKSARIVRTMSMPAFVYRWFFGAHGLKSLKQGILASCGIGPIADSLIGTIESPNGEARKRWIAKVQDLGRNAR
jgi:putative NADPH-quinone reductase